MQRTWVKSEDRYICDADLNPFGLENLLLYYKNDSGAQHCLSVSDLPIICIHTVSWSMHWSLCSAVHSPWVCRNALRLFKKTWIVCLCVCRLACRYGWLKVNSALCVDRQQTLASRSPGFMLETACVWCTVERFSYSRTVRAAESDDVFISVCIRK